MLTQEPHDVFVNQGGTAALVCQATGQPNPDILWTLNSKVVPLHDPRYHLLSDGTLKIENADNTVTGDYECIAKNSMGEVKSRHARMALGNGESVTAIDQKPTVTIRPSILVVTSHQPIALHCEAEGLYFFSLNY